MLWGFMPRTKGYDREVILEKAMGLFWEGGYQATSLQKLVDNLGINKFSIYDAFADKHSFFLAALDRYRENVAANLRESLEDRDKGLQAIKDYFNAMAADLTMPEGRVGCLVQNSTLELVLSDPEVEKRIQETNKSFVDAIQAALVRAVGKGELNPSDDLRQKARLLFATAQGMIVLAKAHNDSESVREVCGQVCLLIDGWQ